MTEDDNSNHSEDDNDTFAEDKCGSLLEEALASNQSVQICRKPSKNRNQNRMSLLSFFGEEEEPDEVVTAAPASLQTMRRTARENLKKRETGRGRPRRGNMRRSHTLQDDGSTAALRRKSTFNVGTPRPLSPTPRAPKPALRRAYTDQPSFLPSTASFLPIGSASIHSQESSDPRHSKAYAEHKETIQRLTVQEDEIQKLLQDPQAFGRLQRVLRKHGAVTNEVLRQVLPLYVKHQLHGEAAKEAERKKRQQQEEEEEQKTMDGQQVVVATES